MSFLDDLKSQVSSALGGAAGQHPGMLSHVIDMVNNPATGGLTGLVQAFESNGLGGVVSSWISTGANQPISPDQISKVLGPERIQMIATKLGVSPETVTTQLSNTLPALINHLTPNGTVPSGNALQQALDALKPKPAPA
jgi:uncharacterized protein YidB (DUF937 family)